MAYLTRQDLAGQHIDGFELRRRIGRGYFGDVYEAIYRANGKLFALKVLDVDATDDARRRFRSEFKILSTVSSTRLVRAYHFGELSDGRLYFTSDLLPGQNFALYLENHRERSLEQVLLWVRQICEAVQALHERGILHRDLKPANLQIDDRGQLTLLDLGSCKCTPAYYAASDREYLTAPEDRYTTVPVKRRDLCSPGFRAPEAAHAEPSPQLDIYSIGAILHRILLGYTPDHPGAAQAREDLASMEVADLLESAIAPEPADRYLSVATLLRDLDFAIEMVRLEAEEANGHASPSEGEEQRAEPSTTVAVPPNVSPGPRPWLRQVFAAACVFALGWFAAGFTQPTDRESVVTSKPAGPNIATQRREPIELTRHQPVQDGAGVPTDQAPSAEPPRLEPSNVRDAPGNPPQASIVPHANTKLETTDSPATVDRSAAKKHVSTQARTAKQRDSGKPKPNPAARSFEQDLRTRLDTCRVDPQKVHYKLRGGKLADLRYEQPPGTITRSCVRDGLRGSYGQHDAQGKVRIGGPS